MIEQETRANTSPPTPVNPDDYSDQGEFEDILSQYWASEKDPALLWDTLADKENEFYEGLERRGLFQMWRLSFSTYFGLSGSSGASSRWQTQAISFHGENGELLEFAINEYRSFLDQIVNMTTKNRPAFQAQAINTDFKSQAQVESADTMAQYYYEQSFGERKEKETAKIERMYGKAYTHIEWDEDGGRTVTYEENIETPTGQVPVKKKAKAGEMVLSRLYPWEAVCEPYRSEFDDHVWRMVVGKKRSKWEMMARFPLFARQIDESEFVSSTYEFQFPGADPLQKEPEGTCGVRVFYHARTPAMPDGRKCIYVNNIRCYDDVLPIEEIPVIPLMGAELHGTSYGISDMWNLICIEQMQNQVMSDIATNLESFGRPPLAVVEGSDIDLDSLANGQKVIFVPPNQPPPTAIKFPEVPAMAFKAVELLRNFRQSVSGLNAIARGETSTNITSGAQAALYSQIAVEAQSDLALSLDLHRERVGNILIAYLKKYAKHPQLVAVAGIDERSYLQEFTSEDWDGIERVKIKTTNPQMKTAAGRMQLLEMLMDMPGQPIKDPGTILTLLETGQIKPAFSATRNAEMRTRQENEALLKGPPVSQVPGEPDPMTGMPTMQSTVELVPVLMTDNAALHLTHHLEVLNSPAAMQNPAVRDAVLTHILEHVYIARSGDPYLAALLSNPPPEQAMAQGAQMPAPEGQEAPKQSATEKKSTQQAMAPAGQDDSRSSLPTPAEPPKNMAEGVA